MLNIPTHYGFHDLFLKYTLDKYAKHKHCFNYFNMVDILSRGYASLRMHLNSFSYLLIYIKGRGGLVFNER